MTESKSDILARNLAQVREQIADACREAGRATDSVCLVAVTKYGDVDLCRMLVDLGHVDLGEARPQQLWEKFDALSGREAVAGKAEPNAIRWHMIGHLQRNKVARTLPRLALLQSGDRWELLTQASDEQLSQGRPPLPTLLEVNISGENAKHGFAPAELRRLAPQLGELPGLEIRGLMAMAGYDSDLDEARRQFAAVRFLRDELRQAVPNGIDLSELSMGMSGDFREAILEGATIVRVGSALSDGVVS